MAKIKTLFLAALTVTCMIRCTERAGNRLNGTHGTSDTLSHKIAVTKDRVKIANVDIAVKASDTDANPTFLQSLNVSTTMFDSKKIQELEALCNKSDGEVSEDLNTLALQLFEKQLKPFIIYLIHNPKSCLKQKLIEELGSSFYPYEKKDRAKLLAEERRKNIVLAESKGLSKHELLFLQNLWNEVNPDVLD
jgi:hypothetical protein